MEFCLCQNHALRRLRDVPHLRELDETLIGEAVKAHITMAQEWEYPGRAFWIAGSFDHAHRERRRPSVTCKSSLPSNFKCSDRYSGMTAFDRQNQSYGSELIEPNSIIRAWVLSSQFKVA